MWASSGGHLETVTALIAAGADVHAVADRWHGYTALMFASEEGHLEVVTALLGAGADVSAVEQVNRADCIVHWPR
jgi:ankyrin repeat protein